MDTYFQTKINRHQASNNFNRSHYFSAIACTHWHCHLNSLQITQIVYFTALLAATRISILIKISLKLQIHVVVIVNLAILLFRVHIEMIILKLNNSLCVKFSCLFLVTNSFYMDPALEVRTN